MRGGDRFLWLPRSPRDGSLTPDTVMHNIPETPLTDFGGARGGGGKNGCFQSLMAGCKFWRYGVIPGSATPPRYALECSQHRKPEGEGAKSAITCVFLGFAHSRDWYIDDSEPQR